LSTFTTYESRSHLERTLFVLAQGLNDRHHLHALIRVCAAAPLALAVAAARQPSHPSDCRAGAVGMNLLMGTVTTNLIRS